MTGAKQAHKRPVPQTNNLDNSGGSLTCLHFAGKHENQGKRASIAGVFQHHRRFTRTLNRKMQDRCEFHEESELSKKSLN